jgi:hypothetical protein
MAAFAAWIALCAPARGEAQAVFRCIDPNGGVLYTDEPCKGGAKLDIPEGKPDPAAIDRLRREQQAFDQRQAARAAAAERDADRQFAMRQDALAYPGVAALAVAPDYPYGSYYWGGGWPVYVPPNLRPPRPRSPRPAGAPSFVPAR